MGSSKSPKKAATHQAAAPAAEPAGEQLEEVSAASVAPDVLAPASEIPDFSADEAELGIEPSLYRWHLSRAVFRGARREWETCTSYPAAEGVLTADVIRDDWGPGTYYAQLRPAAGSGVGHGGVKKTRVFTLAAPRNAAAAAATSTTEALLTKLLEAQQRGFEQLGQALARPAAPATDPQQMLDLALRMAERMSGSKRDADPLEQVTKWFELADRFRAGKDWTDLIGDGLQTLRPLVDVAVTRLGGTPAGAGATPDAGGAPAARANGAPPKLEGSAMLKLVTYLQHQVRYLTSKARAKSSPSLYAEVLLDNLPEGVEFPQVLELLKRPGALDQLLGMLPAEDRIAAQAERAWFEELLTELAGFIEAQIAGTAAPAAAAAPGGDKGGPVSDTPPV